MSSSTDTTPKLRRKILVISVALAVLAPTGWIVSLAGWQGGLWLFLGAAVSLAAALSAAALLERLAAVVISALAATQRAMSGDEGARMRLPPRGAKRDEADDLPHWFNQMTSALRSRTEKHQLPTSSATEEVTGLPSHRHFQERLDEEFRRAERYDHALSLLLIDLDEFRGQNESHGYPAGDDILRGVAQQVRRATRRTDFAARYAGDEFAVLLPETDVAGALQAAAKIRAEVAGHPIRLPAAGDRKARQARVTVSIGVACYPQHSVKKDGLLMAADVAKYMAKHSGRNKVCPFQRVPGAGEVSDPYRLHEFLQNSDWGALEALVSAVDARDHITGTHSKKVATYAVALAKAIGLAHDDVEAVRAAALLHDVGKLGITDRVLVKAGKLEPDERALIESHPAVGEALARRSLNLSAALPGILYHHERHDGAGYPAGLSREEIPIQARIIAVADAYDAMISHRHYRTPPGRVRARRELERGAGRQWDPELVRVFLGLESELAAEVQETFDPALSAAGR